MSWSHYLKLKHQELGRMQMCVNYYNCYERLENENPTIGTVSLADIPRLGYSCRM